MTMSIVSELLLSITMCIIMLPDYSDLHYYAYVIQMKKEHIVL